MPAPFDLRPRAGLLGRTEPGLHCTACSYRSRSSSAVPVWSFPSVAVSSVSGAASSFGGAGALKRKPAADPGTSPVSRRRGWSYGSRRGWWRPRAGSAGDDWCSRPRILPAHSLADRPASGCSRPDLGSDLEFATAPGSVRGAGYPDRVLVTISCRPLEHIEMIKAGRATGPITSGRTCQWGRSLNTAARTRSVARRTWS